MDSKDAALLWDQMEKTISGQTSISDRYPNPYPLPTPENFHALIFKVMQLEERIKEAEAKQ